MEKNSKQRNYLSFLLLFGALGGILKTIIEFVAPWLPKPWKKYPRTAKTIKVSSISLLVLTVASVVISGVLPASEPVSSSPVATPNPPTKEQLLVLVNAERAKYGVSPLKEDTTLDKSAQWKAEDETTNNYFGHVKPGTSGNDGLDYLTSLHPSCVYVSENLHWANPDILTAQETVDGWANSKAHHDAMIDSKYSLTGFGVSGKNVVEHFCQQ